MGFFRAFRPIAFDFLATIVFVGVQWITGNVVLATATGVTVGLARFAWMKLRGLPVGPLQYVSVVLVVVSGTATILTHDLRFMEIKGSFVAAAVAIVMLTTNWMAPYLPPIVTENLEPWIVRWASRAWGVVIFGLAVANAVVALKFSFAVWSAFTAVVPAVVQVAAFAAQFAIFRILIRRKIRAKMAAAPATGTA
jgi:intracellular septation protein A